MTEVELPFGIRQVNPGLLDKWEGPYTSVAEANASIPSAIRTQTQFVKIIDSVDSSRGKLYWYKDGIEDNDLVPFIATLDALTNLNVRGNYSDSEQYYHLDSLGRTDVVISLVDGNTYFCKVNSFGHEPSVSPEFWALFAIGGKPGKDGINGVDGASAVAHINYLGEWVNGNTYNKDDGNGNTDVVVSTIDGNAYWSKVNGNVGHEPSTSPAYWTRFVLKGADGKKGDKGDTGPFPVVGSNGNWWVNGADTGYKVQITIMGIMKGMTVVFDKNLPIPDGYVYTHEHSGETINGVTIPLTKGRVLVGLDPMASPSPQDSTNTVLNNFGAVGNIGGVSKYQLTKGQLPKFSLKIMTSATGNNTSAPDQKEWSVQWSSARKNGNQDYDAKVRNGVPDCGKTSEVGNDEFIDNRMPFSTVCYITKVSDDVPVVVSGDTGSYTDVAKVDASSNVTIPIPTDTWVKDVNIFVLSGNPTINIPSINSGDMTGQEMYPNTVNVRYPTGGSFVVNVTGGTVKIQVVKYNI